LIARQAKAFFADILMIWALIWIYHNVPFYVGFLSSSSKWILIGLGFFHMIALWPFYLKDKRAISYGSTLASIIKRLFLGGLKMLGANPPDYFDPQKYGWFVTAQEKVMLLGLLVKVIFIPIIIAFTLGNYASVQDLLLGIDPNKISFSLEFFNNTLFILILRIMFLVDTLCFLVGYLTDLDILDNHIKSVESTWLGWFVALACYPPFNSATGQFLPSFSNDLAYFSNDTLTAVMRVIILILFGIYTWASVALGPKASNLTNRGVIDYGPYKYVRHPAYFGKTMVWFLTALPAATFFAILSTLGVMFLYFLRAITEERHLLQDPDYVEYCKKVKYRFIPFVF
jgi:protein-S-isoprenylcysteine O-methyltransferase Ste14